MFSTGRHAAPRSRRAVLLPTALLLVSGSALTGLAVLPAAAHGPDPSAGTAVASSRQAGAVATSPAADLLQTWQEGSAVGDARRTRDAAWERAAEADAARRASALRASRARRPAPVAVATPVPVRPGVGALTSRYGPRWGRLHAGIDLASGTGGPVSAVADGVVLSAGTEGGYGNVVRVQHGEGTVSLYAHLSEVLVTQDQSVPGGTLIGREGDSGQSTGPHLHFEIRIGDVPVDPLPWLRSRGLVL